MRKQALLKAVGALTDLQGWYAHMNYEEPFDLKTALEAVQYCLDLET